MQYDRAALYFVLTQHQRKSVTECSCGHKIPLGLSYEQHAADMYEDEMTNRGENNETVHTSKVRRDRRERH